MVCPLQRMLSSALCPWESSSSPQLPTLMACPTQCSSFLHYLTGRSLPSSAWASATWTKSSFALRESFGTQVQICLGTLEAPQLAEVFYLVSFVKILEFVFIRFNDKQNRRLYLALWCWIFREKDISRTGNTIWLVFVIKRICTL